MVLLSHLAGTRGFPLKSVPIGELGVRVFFVISGFLITSLLLQEQSRYGELSLRRFYLRRTFRIFPAYYVYLIAILGAQAIGWVALHPGDAAHAFTYTTNYHPDPPRSWWMGHTWSLAVEEQFYLLWPAVLVAVGPRRGVRAAAAFVIVAPALRLIDWYAMPSWRTMQGESFWTIGDSIAIGCVLAGARARLTKSETWRALVGSRAFAIVPAIVVAAYLASERWPLPGMLIGQTVVIVGIAACIDWALRFPSGAIGRALNTRAMVFVGTLSYSLYLWQQPFFDRRDGLAIAAFPINVSLAAACALASYFVVERPMLAARAWIEAHVMAQRSARRAPPPSQPLPIAR